MKNEGNAWITDDGEFIPVDYMGHEHFAIEYLKKKFKCDFFNLTKRIKKARCEYSWEYLCKEMGWIRLINWTNIPGGAKVVGYKESQLPNEAQRDCLFLWCAINKEHIENL